MKHKEQKIECDVKTCKHLDCDNDICKLNKIKVSYNCKKASCVDDTICSSYKEK